MTRLSPQKHRLERPGVAAVVRRDAASSSQGTMASIVRSRGGAVSAFMPSKDTNLTWFAKRYSNLRPAGVEVGKLSPT